MDIWCTRPSCSNPHNAFPDLDDKSILKTVHQRFCSNCGMPLLLDGRYLPIKLLGQGGFGAAYLAYDRRTPTKHPCVVKQFLPQSELSSDQLAIAHDLFEREAEVLERLGCQHPQIPNLLASFPLSVTDPHTGMKSQFFYLVQEYVEGQTLESRLQESGAFSEEDVLKMLHSLLPVLSYIHKNGAIHRDIKPSNIMQHPSGMYYLLDFGTVKQVAQGASTTGPSTGVFTAGFAPPEQISGQQIYASTDLYALAITTVVALTGKLNPLDCFDSYNNRWNWQQPSLNVSDRTTSVLEKMMASVPSQRYETADEVLQALFGVVNGAPLGTSGAPISQPPPPMSQGPHSGPIPPTVTYPTPIPASGTASPSYPPVSPAPQPPISQPPVSQTPISHPASSQPPISQQPPVSQPPVNQPPVSQPPVSQPPVSPQNYYQNQIPQTLVNPSQPPQSQYPSGPSMNASGPPQTPPVQSAPPGYPHANQGSSSRPQSNAGAKWVKPAVTLGVIALLGLGGCGLFNLFQKPSISTATKTERLSFGERLIVAGDGTTAKTQAIADFKDKNYSQASTGFSDSLDEEPNDPEALIYFNNAEIGEDESHAIAVSIPIDSADEGTQNAAKELLRGVAHAQDSINRTGGINGVSLRVLIVTDANEPESTKKVAKKLVKERDVLAVIGHFGSGATLGAAEVYQAEGLPMISATSTSTDLSDFGDYIFRTVPSDRFTGKDLADYTLQTLKKQKAAVFFNQDSGYSRSLKDAFRLSLLSDDGEVVEEFDLNREDFNALKDVRQAKQKGAEVLVLLANSATLPQAFKVIRANDKELPLLAGDSPYRSTTLEEGGADAEGMVLAVPWHIQADPTATFPAEARKLWKGDVSWRTAMAYDAAQALIEAIMIASDKDIPTRQGVRAALAKPDFAPSGASGDVKFFKSGDRKRQTQLVKVVPGNHSSGFVFAPTK